MPLTLVNRDITTMATDAVVNAANTDLVMGGGVCGAIFRAAGVDELQAACTPMAPISTGGAVITPGFALPARYIIHTAGPIYREQKADLCRVQLHRCYLNSLALAEENGCESIAFPLISAGIYGYPREEAVRIAEESIREYLQEHEMDVYLLIREKTVGLADQILMRRVNGYLESLLPSAEPDHAVLQSMRAATLPQTALGSASLPSQRKAQKERPHSFKRRSSSVAPEAESACASPDIALENLVSNLDESFSETLLRLIDSKGRTDVDVYKRANMDRKLFSKIRTGKGYMHSKRTALALAVSLELNLRETEDLLSRAGYALSHSQRFDVIVEYFIINGIYDIFLINEALFHFDQPLLGGS